MGDMSTEGKSPLWTQAKDALDTQLEGILERAEILEDHLSNSFETLSIKISQDDLRLLETTLSAVLSADEYKALFEEDYFTYAQTRTALEGKYGEEVEDLMKDLPALRFHTYCYQPFREGPRKGEGCIYINVPEYEYGSGHFHHAMTCEFAHHLLHTQRPESHGTLSEFYDFALSWWAEPDVDVLLEYGCVDVKLNHSIMSKWEKGEGIEYFSLVEEIQEELRNTPGMEAGLKKFMGYSGGGHYFRTDSFLFDYVQETLRRIHSTLHIQAHKVVWEVLSEINRYSGCPIASRESHNILTEVAVKAMYDDSVDFTCPDTYLKDVKERLPEYLSPKTS